MCERKKTPREEALDEIVEETGEARRHLERASRVAESTGDKAGAKELAEEVERVEAQEKKYEGIRDKRSG